MQPWHELELVLGPGSRGVAGYEEGSDDGVTEPESGMPRISARAEAEVETRLLAAICRARKAARGL